MSHAPTRIKQAAEVRLIPFDFNTKLQPGDGVASIVAVEASGITASGQALVGNVVKAFVSGGDGTHRISCRVLTQQGETLELDVDVRVVDGEN